MYGDPITFPPHPQILGRPLVYGLEEERSDSLDTSALEQEGESDNEHSTLRSLRKAFAPMCAMVDVIRDDSSDKTVVSKPRALSWRLLEVFSATASLTIAARTAGWNADDPVSLETG